jgi:hypothetical protein
MTNEERKVMEQALEALESSRVFVTSREKIKHPEGTDWYDERISAIKEALAQPEQEPVAWEQFYPDIGKPKFVAQPEQEEMKHERSIEDGTRGAGRFL